MLLDDALFRSRRCSLVRSNTDCSITVRARTWQAEQPVSQHSGKKMHGLIQVHWPALPFLKEPDNKEKQTLLEFSGGCQVVEIQPMHHLGSEAKAFCWPWKNNNPEMPGKRRSVKQAKLIEASETNAFTKLH